MESSTTGDGPAPSRPLQSLPLAGTRVLYVVLHHSGIAEPHFDLMLQVDGQEKLLTWRVTTPPDQWPPSPGTIERIADHRPIYMTFEGEIAGGRGSVRRIAAGEALVLTSDARAMTLSLAGSLQCELTLPL